MNKNQAKREAVKASLTSKLKSKTARRIAKHGTFNNLKVSAIQQRATERRRIYEESKGR